MSDMVNLRGHHLLCILTHSGSGYTAGFTYNLSVQIERINNGAEIGIVSGPDDICAAFSKAGAETCAHAKICTEGRVIKEHDLLALKDVADELQLPALQAGDILKLGNSDIRDLRAAFASGAVRDACAGCPWHAACSEVAARNFAGAKLMPEAVPIPLHPPQRAYGQSSLDP
jgi:hypothetical protein